MIVFIGLVVLVAAVIAGVAGVVANNGESHAVTTDFTVFDYHFTGSTGLLFACGIALGALGMLGLILVLAGAWSSSRRSMAARRELRQSRREMAAVQRDLVQNSGQPRPAPAPVARESGWNRFVRRPQGTSPETQRTQNIPAQPNTGLLKK